MSKSVHDMFSSISARYDLANDILSFGVHRYWRKKALKLATIPKSGTALDLCTGTGALAFELERQSKGQIKVIGLDFVQQMLARAAVHSNPCCRFIRADALSLPFPDHVFDIATIAFGIRNVDNPQLCLKEIYRVLKPGGRIMVLEFGQPRYKLWAKIYAAYSRYVLPWLGGFITGNREAYRYLPETSWAFPSAEAFQQLLDNAGFVKTSYYPFLGGVSFAYIGQRGLPSISDQG